MVLTALPAAAKTHRMSSDPIVITVAGAAIHRNQIDTLAELMDKAQSAQSNTPNNPTRLATLKKLVATKLIGEELLRHEARVKHIALTAQDIDTAMRGFKAQFPDQASYHDALRQAGETEAALKAKIEKQLLANKVLATRVDKIDPPTEADMRAFWAQHHQEFPVNDSLRALQILMLVGDTTSAQEADQKRYKLQEIRDQLIRDSDDTPLLIRRFMAAASEFSEGPEGKSGGDLQRFDPHDFHPAFQKEVRTLHVGQLSPVFRTPLGYHLILLIEKYDGQYQSYRLEILQALMGQREAKTEGEIRRLLKSLADKYPVKYLDAAYRDSSETGIYN